SRIPNQTASELPGDEHIHHVVRPEYQRVQVVIELRAGLSSFHAEHDSGWVPIACLRCEQVLGDLRNELSNQGLGGTLNIYVGELISGRQLQCVADMQDAIQFPAQRPNTAKIL